MSFEPVCPHCRRKIEVAGDSERYPYHTTYYGEQQTEDTCPHCGKAIWLHETVIRTWTAGLTADDARKQFYGA